MIARAIRERLDVVPGSHRPRPVATGAATLVVVAFATWAGFAHRVPLLGGSSGRVVWAQVANATGLDDRTPVRLGGVTIGHVDHVLAAPDGRTSLVALRVTSGGVVLHADAAAHVYARTLLGGAMEIELEPGSPSAPVLGRGPIRLARTNTQVDWDDFNQPLTSRTRQAERQMLKGLRATLSDPPGLGHTLRVAGPALAVVGRGAEALRGRETGDLRRLVRTTAATTAALTRDRGALAGLVDGAARTLAVTAAERAPLGQAIELSPPALDSSTTTMRRLRTTLDRLDPLVARLRPGASALGPATVALRPMLGAADRVLRDSRPLLRAGPATLRALAAMSRQGTPLLDALSPTAQRLNADLIPFLERRDAGTKLRAYEAIGPFFSALDSGAGEYDASGYYLHFMTGLGLDSVLIPCDVGLSGEELARCKLSNDALRSALGAGGASR